MRAGMTQQIWTSEEAGTLHGVPFRFSGGPYDKLRTTADEIIVLKPKQFFDHRAGLGDGAKRVVELGIFQGGSILLFADRFPEATIVGIDWAPGNPAIRDHVEAMGFGDRVHLHFGTSQDDAERVPSILSQTFGNQAIDLVIDDASHMYGFTTRSFDLLWPRLSVGGRYVIEDWGWAYWPGYVPPPQWLDEPKPMAAMIHELLAAAAAFPGMLQFEQIHHAQAVIRKLGDLPPFAEIARAAQAYRPPLLDLTQ
jgi:predicted O-methyltransferase YrrM